MVKFGLGTKDGRMIIGVGLSRENMERLMTGKPMLLKLEQWGAPEHLAEALAGLDLLIVGGEDEDEILGDLRANAQEHDIPYT